MSSSELTTRVKPISWYNFLSWARETAIKDKRTYCYKSRSMSARRFWCTLKPNLRQPIFIVGSPRSGTTFLGSCIAELPEISYHLEPVATKAAARYVYENKWNSIKAKWFYRTVYAWLMRLHFDGDLQFAEKTPRNCFLIDFLYRTFPDAKFIHIIRDGRDAALSHSKKPWLQAASAKSGKRETAGYLHGPYARFWIEAERKHEFEETSDIHRCIWTWRCHIEAILAQTANLPDSQYYELRYEALVNKPKEEAERLLNFLNIVDSDSRNLLYQEFARANTNSLGRWQQELSPQQLEQIEMEAGSILQKLGYLD
ncbi:sulfotransferase [Myxosarcina sp. GI1]|uniref:sulfotransferase family protein n=1 Tax=Myxosarcina sp. GI1 TaxID=1541065 RepID=UPI0005631598|nr:sulfotransferase [Myxosarcina sp. GI1]